MAEASVIGGKSINQIRAQRARIEDAFRSAYYRAESTLRPGQELDTELERLNRRLQTVNNITQRYEGNISRTPQYEATSRQLRETFRNGGRSPEESRETARRINELREQRNNRRYARSVYSRRNNR